MEHRRGVAGEEAWWRYAARTDLDWRRPEPVRQSKLARMADDVWMSLKSKALGVPPSRAYLGREAKPTLVLTND